MSKPADEYLKAVRDLRKSGQATAEQSFYPAVNELLRAIGSECRPKRVPLPHPDDVAAKRWLRLLSEVGLTERDGGQVRVLWNPSSLGTSGPPPDQQAHIISPATPFQNILALREVLRQIEDWLWWFEPHLPPKVLEILHGELQAGQVTEVRLLSGPANISKSLQGDMKRARKEWESQRGIDLQWRVLPKASRHDHHDRLLLGPTGAYNVPPLNTILKGSTSEILPSNLSGDDFEEWWSSATDLSELQLND